MANTNTPILNWDRILSPTKDFIEAAFHHEYLQENDPEDTRTQWLPGGIHLRVWPMSDISVVMFWVLILPNEDIRIFDSRSEAEDAAVLRALTPDFQTGAPLVNLSWGRHQETGDTVFYVHSLLPSGQDGVLSLDRRSLLKFLGPTTETSDWAKERQERTYLNVHE